MKDKYTHNLIDGLDEIELLGLDFDGLIDDDDLNELDVDIDKIKKRTHEKIGIKNIRKYKKKSIAKFIATIALILLIGTPITLAFVNNFYYKYDSNSGHILESKKPIYILKEPIVKEVNGGEIKIINATVTEDESYEDFYDGLLHPLGKFISYIYGGYEPPSDINIDYTISNISGFKYIKMDIIANGKNITNHDKEYDTLSNISGCIGSTFYSEENNKFKLIVTLMDSDKKTKKLEFDLELEKAKSVEEYNENIPKDTENNITISAITKEEKNNQLYAELIAVPTLQNFNFEVDTFGRDIYDNKGSNIFLVDSNGNKIEGQYVEDDIKNNIFKFDTTGMKKPFTLEINEISVTNENNSRVKISLPKLKFGQSLELNKKVDIENKNNLLTKENHNVIINKVERNNIDGLDSYIIEIEYPNNKNSNFKILDLDLGYPFFSLPFTDMYYSSISQSYANSESKSSIIVDLQDQNDHNYTGRDKPKGVKFTISPYTYSINGNWRLNLD